MALTLGRWITVAALGSGLIGVALLPPPLRPERRVPYQEPSKEMRDRYQIQALLRKAELALERARMSATIDSLSPETFSGTWGLPVVLPIGGAAEASRDSLARRLAQVWQPIPGDTAIKLGLILRGQKRGLEWESRYKLPGPSQAACIVSLGTWDWAEESTDDATFYQRAASTLGPCLFFYMYGKPGKEVGSWIGGVGLAYGTRMDLTLRSSSSSPGEARSGPMYDRINWSVYGSFPIALECLRGQLKSCERAVLPPPSLPNQETAAGAFEAPPHEWLTPFGGATADFLSDLRRAKGDARFQRFWKSDLPVGAAFQDAFGTTIGQWTHEWLSRSWAGFRPGPLPARRSAAFAGGLMLVFLGVALTIGGRTRLVR